jgi:cholesterol oxidase
MTDLTDVRPLHVGDRTDVTADEQGRYVVTAHHIDADGNLLERVVLTVDALLLAAGSMHTSRLLVRARDSGALLPHLNEQVGRHYSLKVSIRWV